MWARATAVVSEPPRPKKVTSPWSDTPWDPPTTGTRPRASAPVMRPGVIWVILASVWHESVRNPAWLPVNDAARHSQVAERHGHEGAGLALASGDQHVDLASRRVRSQIRGHAQELVGLAAHGRDDQNDHVATASTARHMVGHDPNSVGAGHRGATELLHDERHG